MLNTRISVGMHSQKGGDVFLDFEQFFECTNKALFESKLEKPVFSFTRNSRCKGAFQPKRYTSVEGQIRHGVTINSEYCQSIGDDGAMNLIGFLLVQQARHDLGPEGRNGKRGTPGNVDVWSLKVLARIGLDPFLENGEEERQTGYGLSVRRVEGGLFDLMCRELAVTGFRFRWRENAPNVDGSVKAGSGMPPEQKKQTRDRYECPECGLVALAKPGVQLACGSCNLAMPRTEPSK